MALTLNLLFQKSGNHPQGCSLAHVPYVDNERVLSVLPSICVSNTHSLSMFIV